MPTLGSWLWLLFVVKCVVADNCTEISVAQCCSLGFLAECFNECQKTATEYCPELYHSRFSPKPAPHTRPPLNWTHEEALTSSQRFKRADMCGTKDSNYLPCVSRRRANGNFQQCCERFVDENCLELCKYETHEEHFFTTLREVKKKNCTMTNVSAILHCAAQNRNNKACCQHLELGSSGSENCLRLCNPSEERINTLEEADMTCFQNWHILMFCHLSGLT